MARPLFRRLWPTRTFAVAAGKESAKPSSSALLIDQEHKYGAHNYHPLPIVFSRAKDVHVWDPEGRKGHCHEKIVNALIQQARDLTLSSRAFYNDKFPIFAQLLSNTFGYEMVLPMNTGAEGVETAIKLARKWAYENKRVPKDQAVIVSCCGCFHGRTIGVISMSCDNEATRGFGPLLQGHLKVDFGNIAALESVLKEHGDRIAAFLFEPIQGEAGVIVPPEEYLKEARRLCSLYNVLMIADEIQTGIGRTGKLLACDWEEVRPDVVILGKALGGGVLPVSAVLADRDVMLCIRPGEHGSTFGGNPLASAVGIAALNVVKEEELAQRAAHLGKEFREHLNGIRSGRESFIKEVRGRGLLNAIELSPEVMGPVSAYDVCMFLKDRGILAKPTHETIIRFSPPLTIKSMHLQEAADALKNVFDSDVPKLRSVTQGQIPKAPPEPCDRCGRYKYRMPETEL